MPGHYLEINYEDIGESKFFDFRPIKWWDPVKVSQSNCKFNINDENFVLDEVHKMLLKSVEEKKNFRCSSRCFSYLVVLILL